MNRLIYVNKHIQCIYSEQLSLYVLVNISRILSLSKKTIYVRLTLDILLEICISLYFFCCFFFVLFFGFVWSFPYPLILLYFLSYLTVLSVYCCPFHSIVLLFCLYTPCMHACKNNACYYKTNLLLFIFLRCMQYKYMYACMHVCMHEGMQACSKVHAYILYQCMHACMHACMHTI